MLQSNLAKLKSKVSHYEEENMLLQTEIKKLESQVSTELDTSNMNLRTLGIH